MLWPKASPGTKPPDSIQKENDWSCVWLRVSITEGTTIYIDGRVGISTLYTSPVVSLNACEGLSCVGPYHITNDN